jgi:OOP family OmpA-OmpF porin
MNGSPLKRFRIAAGLLAAAVILAPPAGAEHPTADVGILGGLVFPDDAVVGHGFGADDVAIGIGLHGNWFFADHWSIFADGLYTPAEGARYGDAKISSVRIGPRVFGPSLERRIQFFADLGAGVMNVNLDDAEAFSRPFASAGIGQRYRIRDRLAAHWELRADWADTEDDDVIRNGISQAHALVGLSLTFGGGAAEGDADRDGVLDSQDHCPDTPRGAKVDARGCPMDSDGDGVYDGLDRCPDTPTGWPVDEHGCPLDSDGDGVADGADECPNTPRGTEVDAKGCPKPAPLFELDEKGQAKPLILEGVNFEYDSARLTPDSREVLDRVAESLKAWPDVRVEVGGHTDWDGSNAYNQSLSQRRADSVRAYLIDAGVAASRMTTRGYGEESPIATNETPEGRARNRRVELKKAD